jgi:hypothetical protein
MGGGHAADHDNDLGNAHDGAQRRISVSSRRPKPAASSAAPYDQHRRASTEVEDRAVPVLGIRFLRWPTLRLGQRTGVVKEISPQPASDLLRGVLLDQIILDSAAQHHVAVRLGRLGPAGTVIGQRVRRRGPVAPTRIMVADQLSRDRRRAAPKTNHLRERRRSDAVYAKGVSVAPAR